MLVFNCHVTNYHKVSSLDYHRLTIWQFPWGQGPGTAPLGPLLSQKAAVKVSTRAGVSSGAWIFLPSLCGCWQSSLPCSCGTRGSLQLLLGQQDNVSAALYAQKRPNPLLMVYLIR